jgi:hypothetical protein
MTGKSTAKKIANTTKPSPKITMGSVRNGWFPRNAHHAPPVALPPLIVREQHPDHFDTAPPAIPCRDVRIPK